MKNVVFWVAAVAVQFGGAGGQALAAKAGCYEMGTCADRARHVSITSAETKAQREKRLKRECKGRPNAGACLGFAR